MVATNLFGNALGHSSAEGLVNTTEVIIFFVFFFESGSDVSNQFINRSVGILDWEAKNRPALLIDCRWIGLTVFICNICLSLLFVYNTSKSNFVRTCVGKSSWR